MNSPLFRLIWCLHRIWDWPPGKFPDGENAPRPCFFRDTPKYGAPLCSAFARRARQRTQGRRYLLSPREMRVCDRMACGGERTASPKFRSPKLQTPQLSNREAYPKPHSLRTSHFQRSPKPCLPRPKRRLPVSPKPPSVRTFAPFGTNRSTQALYSWGLGA